MASVVYNEFARASAAGEIDLNAAGTAIKARLLMSDTTCDTENDGKTFLSGATGFTTIDVSDATGYADVELANKAVNKDDDNNRAEFDADDVVFSGLSGDATRNYVGVLIYKFVTDDTASIPIAFIEFTAPIVKEATQVTVPWDAEGIIQLTAG
jgi:hypothetical protein